MLDLTPAELEASWQRVLENAGCAGADGVTVEHYARHGSAGFEQLAEEIAGGAYRCLPLLKIVVQKPGAKEHREFLVPTVRDRVVQTAVARRLSKSFEEEFLEASQAYRPGRSVDRAIARVIQWRDRGCLFVVAADIHAFFERVSHRILLGKLQADSDARPALPLIEQWVNAWYWDGRRLHKMRRGVAQGAPISPLLANYFLSEFDRRMEAQGARLTRYADDILLLCETSEEAQRVLETVREELQRLDLELNPEKSEVGSFAEGFTFLGAMFLRDKVYTPWKHDHARGRVVFMAHRMPHALLNAFRERKRGRRPSVPQAVPRPAQAATGSPGGTAMSFLYLTEQGSILRKSGDRLIVEAEDRVILDLPYHKLEAVLVFGNVQITSAAAGEMLDKGVRLSFFARHGRFLGAAVPASGKNVLLRVRQFQAYQDEKRAIELARAIVQQKIMNEAGALDELAGQNPGLLRPGWRSDFEEAAGGCAAAPAIAMLDGIEGSAARSYFDCLMRFNKSRFAWEGRRKHPAPDPLNALLSLTYTLLTHELTGLLDGVGLDPYLGFLHQIDYGRPSLALDLMEAFRAPVADRFVLRFVNLGIAGENDFHRDPEEHLALLAAPAAKRFFAEYETWMLQQRQSGRSFRQSLRADVERLASAIDDGTAWTPFRMEAAREAPCDT
jgi:CRISP-associated protein Cas1